MSGNATLVTTRLPCPRLPYSATVFYMSNKSPSWTTVKSFSLIYAMFYTALWVRLISKIQTIFACSTPFSAQFKTNHIQFKTVEFLINTTERHIKTFYTQLKTIDKRFKIYDKQINMNDTHFNRKNKVTLSYVYVLSSVSFQQLPIVRWAAEPALFWIPREKLMQKSNVICDKQWQIK